MVESAWAWEPDKADGLSYKQIELNLQEGLQDVELEREQSVIIEIGKKYAYATRRLTIATKTDR
jgi:hypothetical protein